MMDVKIKAHSVNIVPVETVADRQPSRAISAIQDTYDNALYLTSVDENYNQPPVHAKYLRQQLNTICENAPDRTLSMLRRDLQRAYPSRHAILLRALYLKAVCANHVTLLSSPKTTLVLLRQFSSDLMRMSEQHISDCFGPYAIEQRFTSSCGAAVVLQLLQVSDPLIALAVWQEKSAEPSIDDYIGRFERRVMAQHACPIMGRPHAVARDRLMHAMEQLMQSRLISVREKNFFCRWVMSNRKISASVRPVLMTMRQQENDFPSTADLALVRAIGLRPWLDEGLSDEQLLEVINREVANKLGVRYIHQPLECRLSKVKRFQLVDKIELHLREGFLLPFGSTNPDHFMILLRIRQQIPHRQLMVMDPFSGTNFWICESQFFQARWVVTKTGLPVTQNTPNIDGIFFPGSKL